MSNYEEAAEYAAECGIPDEKIDEVLENAQICERYDCGPNGEGACAENTRFLIDRAADTMEVK